MSTTDRDALLTLAELLAPGTADRVASAYDDPDTFLTENEERLDERGIDEPIPNLPWIVLVDAVTDAGLLAEVDWKEASDEIVRQLRELRSSPAADAWAWFDGDDDGDVLTWDFLKAAGTALRPAGVTLVSLDIESDCYPLMLLPTADVSRVLDLANTAGYQVDVLAS